MSRERPLVIVVAVGLSYTVLNLAFNLFAVYRVHELSAWARDLNKLYDLDYQTSWHQSVLVKSWLMVVPCTLWGATAAAFYASALFCGRHRNGSFKLLFSSWLALAPAGHLAFDMLCFAARASLCFMAAKELAREKTLVDRRFRQGTLDVTHDLVGAEVALVVGSVIHLSWAVFAVLTSRVVCRYEEDRRKLVEAGIDFVEAEQREDLEMPKRRKHRRREREVKS